MPQNQVQSQPPPAQPPPRPGPGLGDFAQVLIPIVLIVVIWFFMGGKAKTAVHEDMPSARFANEDEIRKGNIKARKQLAERKLTKTAYELNPESGIKFASCNPGGIVPGLSGMGKSLNFMIPLILSAIDQEHTIFVADAEGELMEATAAYARQNGYAVHVYAPGIEEPDMLGEVSQFTGVFNFLDVMRHSSDKAKAQEISRALNVNNTEGNEKRHAFFGPQSDALLETALMLAKGSDYPDMLMVWAILTLPDLAKRLAIAVEKGRFQKELSPFAKESSAGIRAAAAGSKSGGDSTSANIQSSVFNMFSKFIDPGIARVFLPPSSIPLEHTGKSIVYGRIDRTQITATAPLVSTAFHLWFNYNLDPQRKRTRNLTGIIDEAQFTILPDLEALAKLARKKGGNFWLAYQQNSGMEEAYGVKRWKGIAANLKNKVYFNTGETDYHKVVSESLGTKTIVVKTANSSTSSKNRTSGESDQFKEVPLVSTSTLDGMDTGNCVVVSKVYRHPVSFIEKMIPYDEESDRAKMLEKSKDAWWKKILPAMQEAHSNRSPGFHNFVTQEHEKFPIEAEIATREFAANWLLPLPEVVEKMEEKEAEEKAKAEAPSDKEPVAA